MPTAMTAPGRMLVTAKRGRALYILPHGRCRSTCLSVVRGNDFQGFKVAKKIRCTT